MPCRTDSHGYMQRRGTCYMHAVLNMFMQSEALYTLTAESVVEYLTNLSNEDRKRLKEAVREIMVDKPAELAAKCDDDDAMARARFVALFLRDLYGWTASTWWTHCACLQQAGTAV